MASSKNKKIITGLLAVATLGVAVYFLTRKKPSDDELDISDDELDISDDETKDDETKDDETKDDETKDDVDLSEFKVIANRPAVVRRPKPSLIPTPKPSLVPTPKLQLKKNQYGMGHLSKRRGRYQVVSLTNRPSKGKIKKGQIAIIKGTTFNGVYPIKDVWIDSNNRVGAIYLPIRNRYMPRSNRDETFKGKGIIEIKRPNIIGGLGFSSVTGTNEFEAELLNDI